MTSSSTRKWNVLIESMTSDEVTTYRLPVTTKLVDVLSRWKTDLGITGSWRLRRVDGSEVEALWTLEETGELSPGSRTVTLVAEEAARIRVCVPHAPERWVEVDAVLNQGPGRLHEAVRAQFQLTEERLFRLCVDTRPLRYNMTLAQQGVSAESELQLDLGVEVTVIHAQEKRCSLVFASESLSSAFSLSSDERLLLGHHRVAADSPIGLLLPSLVWTCSEMKLHIERRQQVALVTEDIRLHHVWPSDVLSDVSRRHLTLDGEPLTRQATLTSIGAQNGAVLTPQVRVAVRLSDSNWKFVKVPRGASVAELRRALGPWEGGKFSLSAGGRCLRDEEAVTGTDLMVERTGLWINVSLEDRTVRWGVGFEGIDRTGLLLGLARKGGGTFEDLQGLVLICEGCGRRIREECQRVPVDCCRMRSLRLKKQASVREMGTQTMAEMGTWLKEGEEEGKVTVHFLNDFCHGDVFSAKLPALFTVADLRSSAAAYLSQSSADLWLSLAAGCDIDDLIGVYDPLSPTSPVYCEADGTVCEPEFSYWRVLDDAEHLLTVVGRSLLVRVSPLRIASLYVESEMEETPEDYFHLHLPLKCDITVGELRMAVAKATGVTQEMVLSRPMATVEDVDVFGMEVDGVKTFKSIDGRDWTMNRYFWRTLTPDSAHVPLLPGLNSLRLSPFPMREFVVDIDFQEADFRFTENAYYVKPGCTGAELKASLAGREDLPKSSQVHLSRPVAWHQGREVFGVADEKRDDWKGFADMEGKWECDEKEVEMMEYRSVADEAVFQFVPNYMTWVRVSPSPLATFFIMYTPSRTDEELKGFRQLPFTPEQSMSELAKALAWWEEHDLTRPKMWIERRVARKGDRLLFQVADRRRPDWRGFSEATGGRVAEWYEVEDTKWKIFKNDEKFSLVPGFANVIRISCYKPRPFLIYNDLPNTGLDARIVYDNLPLKRSASVGDVRRAVALRIGVPAYTVGISRRMGRLNDSPVYEVAVDSRPGWRGFCNATGQIELDEDTDNWEKRLLNDSEPFVIVSRHRNQIRVFSSQ